MEENNSKRQSGMVRVRDGFSDRMGISSFSKALQTTEFSNETRTTLSNRLYDVLEYLFEKSHTNLPYGIMSEGEKQIEPFCKAVLNDVFHQRAILHKGYGYDWKEVFELINDVIEHAVYNEVLDVFGYCCVWLSRAFKLKNELYPKINRLFEEEHIGYRFLNGLITPITDEQELETVDEACQSPIEGCRKQIQKAVAFLSDRQNPDYKNCIKESISAVESLCQVIVGDDKATLGDALKKLEDNGVQIHPALKQGFSKLYGYTSDQGGIRHAEGMFESNVTFEEAKYMLVSCSAFINYLIAEYGKKGN